MEKYSEEIHTDPRFRIGMRNIKTGLAVGLCLIFFQAIGLSDGIQAAIAAIICMKSSLQNSIQTGMERIVGTAIGAALGILALLLIESTDFKILTVLAILGVILIIYLCNILKVQASIVISLVVFLIILIGEKDTPPIIYGAMRLGETFFGILVAYFVNRFFDVRHVKKLIKSDEAGTPPAIREGHFNDLSAIMALWLESNISSHTAVDSIYWHENYDWVKNKIREDADVFVYETRGKISGFIAIVEECNVIALCAAKGSQDPVKNLILHCQDLYPCLNIKVFTNNEKLVESLVNLNFFIEKEGVNVKASADELTLSWSNKS